MTDALFISFFFQSLSLVSHASSRCFSFSDFQNSLGVPHLHKFVRGDAVSNRASCCDYVISIVPQTTFVRYFCCAYWFHLMYWFLPRVGISCLWQLKLSFFFFCCFRLMLLPRHLSHSAPPCSSLHEISHVALLRVRFQSKITQVDFFFIFVCDSSGFLHSLS